MSKRKTTIEVSEDVWKKLHFLKEVGDSFDAVLRRVLKIDAEHKDG